MSKFRDDYNISVLTPSAAKQFALEVGFFPEKVTVFNLDNMVKMEWFRGMADDEAIITLPVEATAAVGTVAADAKNTGNGTSPAMAGTYSGKYKGTLTLECTLAGEMGAAKMKATFPDGSVVENWVTGASNTAKEVAQGVTFKLTSGAEDDLVLGDKFTSELTPAGAVYGVTEKGIVVGTVNYHKLGDDNEPGDLSGKYAQGIVIGLNTAINIASNTLLIRAE